MATVEVSRRIAATPAEVWSVLADLAGHVSWMEDARAITFTTARRSGPGTEFDCDTVMGPIRLVDHMRVTEWDPGRAIAIQHVRPVPGTGRITMEPAGDAGDAGDAADAVDAPIDGPAADDTAADDTAADDEPGVDADRATGRDGGPREKAGALRRVTLVTWSEELTLPWWLGGPAGGAVAARILHRVWGRSLANLQRLVEEQRKLPPAPT